MKLRIIMHASHDRNGELTQVKSILDKQGLTYSVYGKWPWRGFGEKIHTIREAALEYPDDILLHIDAFDTMVIGTEADILDRFADLHHPWVFNAEPHVWPQNRGITADDYPEVDTPWRFLNSGCHIGFGDYITQQFDRWGLPPYYVDDQLWYAGLYLREPGVIKLDHGCKLFQVLIGCFQRCEISDGKLHNVETDTYPLVLHHNGGGKITDYKGLLW